MYWAYVLVLYQVPVLNKENQCHTVQYWNNAGQYTSYHQYYQYNQQLQSIRTILFEAFLLESQLFLRTVV